jgi:hypothetical protein
MDYWLHPLAYQSNRVNIKGEPMVDNKKDAVRWTEKYKVEVVTEERSSIGE